MRLIPVKRSELIRRLRGFGWDGPFYGGSHEHMRKGLIKLTIPNPHGEREIGVHLLRVVLDEAGIPRDEWLSAR